MVKELWMFGDSLQIKKDKVQLHGKGLFSKEEVIVSINKLKKGSGITFVLSKGNINERIPARVQNVTNANRNTVLTNGKESLCLIEHFLAACSIVGASDLEISTNQNELVIGDGSAQHWHEALLKINAVSTVKEKYDLKEPVFLKSGNKEIVAIPYDGFKVSYYMDWDHKVLGKLFASWSPKDGVDKVIRARTFGTKEENDFFGVSDRILTLGENGFSKELYEPLEPLYHKILDIIGDLTLSGVNPLEVNMHVIGFKSGHALNVELAKQLVVFL